MKPTSKDFPLMTAADLLRKKIPEETLPEENFSEEEFLPEETLPPTKPPKKTALMKATDLLAMQEQSSKNLRRKLISRKYGAKETDEAIDKLKQYNYIDDEATCRRQFEVLYAEGKLSVRQICVKLLQRGFDKDFAEKLIPDDCDEHDRKIAEKIAEKKFSTVNFAELDAKERAKFRNKLWQNLASRGFDGEIISETLEKFIAT